MAENEKLEGMQMEELEALAGEFTLDDLAEFDNEFEFDVSDLDSIKPVYTTKEKLKLILMNNTVFSIIKWCIAALGLVGLVLYILAAVDSGISESLTTSLSAGVRNVLTTISNVLPVSLLEVLALVVVAGLLGYAGFLIYKTIKEKEGIKIAGFWVQFGYVLLAIFGFGFLLYTLTFGVTTNRTKLYKSYLKDSYKPNIFRVQTLDSALIYYSDQINQVACDGIDNIYYTNTGHSRYASTGSSVKEISDAVNACFDAAAEDYKFLKGPKVNAKTMLGGKLYASMGVGSIYSPITSEVLINNNFPELAIPMQVGRAIAKQRGITNDSEASFISFLVLTEYADQLADAGSEYNTDFIKYAAYMDAYLEVGNVAYKCGPDYHLMCSSALKESAKKDIIAYVKALDALYGNVSKLEFNPPSEKTSTEDYKNLAKILYVTFNEKVDSGAIEFPRYNTEKDPVPVKSEQYFYLRYLVSYFSAQEAGEWGETVQEVYNEIRPEALPNDGSGAGLEESEGTTEDVTEEPAEEESTEAAA